MFRAAAMYRDIDNYIDAIFFIYRDISRYFFGHIAIQTYMGYTALSMSYILGQSSDQAHMTVISVGVLVGLYIYVVVLMVTVLYHLIVAILKACKMYDRARENIYNY